MTDARMALLVDYGGVLTTGLGDAWDGFELAHGLPRGTVVRLLRAGYASGTDDGPIARLERGEVDRDEFEAELAQQFAAAVEDAGGDPASLPPGDGLVERLLGGLAPEGGTWGLVADARAAGHATVLLSNSWGFSAYPRARLETAFDHLVISGEVGMRKPEARIFRHAAELAGVAVEDCVFVDDLAENVEAAEALGMTAVLHVEDQRTRAAVARAMGLPTSDDRGPDDRTVGGAHGGAR